MSSANVVVTGIGMTTPVGLTAAQSCAAVRGGIAAITELEHRVEIEYEPTPVMGCAIGAVTDGYLGLGRWSRLATSALRDLMATTRLSAEELGASALYLALPPLNRGGIDARVPQSLGTRIGEWLKAPGLSGRTYMFPYGHAAAAGAFAMALQHIGGGAVERGIVCGVDSLVEPETLDFLLSKRRLKIGDHVDGFIPGEAAACLLLERASTATARGASPLAVVDAAGTAMESSTVWADAPSTAVGLSDAVRSAFAQLPNRGTDTGLVICDLNGESYRAKEYGTTAVRALAKTTASWALWHPADCIGDTGAAAFTVSACIGVRALAKDYAKTNRALVIGSSDDGLRGALSLRRASAEV